MEQAGVPLEQMICVAGGECIELGDGVTVWVFPSQHSCVWSHGQMHQPGEVCIGDLGVTWQEQHRRMGELMDFLSTELDAEASAHVAGSLQGDRGDGGALIFVFETPDGSILFQDTSGHWSGILRDLRPDVSIMAAAGRGNIDGEPIQGSLAAFIARQSDMLRPSKLILCHHDNWLPGFSVDTDVQPIRDLLQRVAPRVELLELDYLDGREILPI